jgi:excisionase family DNA binding protein
MLDVLTTTEAAEQVGVSPVTIRQWVHNGWLTPLNPGKRPLKFRWLEVSNCHADHRKPHERARFDTLRSAYIEDVGTV